MLEDYKTVAERIAEFKAVHPDGRLRPADPTQTYQIVQVGQDTLVIYVAAAYRSPDDLLPGIGSAQEYYPGRTQFTRGSELQNAETSAWGRAIVAALAADTSAGVASREEVRNRHPGGIVAGMQSSKTTVSTLRARPTDDAVQLFKDITEATTVGHLRTLYVMTGGVAEPERQQLRDHIDTRRAELEKTNVNAS